MASNIRTISRSFAGGEITPEMYGRIDDAKFQTGLALCRNFIVAPHGPAANRGGTRFVREVKTSAKRTALRPFSYSTTQTMVLEFGDGYIRFHTQGATLLSGAPAAYNGATAYIVGDMFTSGGVVYYVRQAATGVPLPDPAYYYAMPSDAYEIPTPYLEADLFDIHYVQSADVLTLVHPNYPVKELRRLGATRWVLSDVSFVSSLAAPTGVGAVATVTGTGLKTQSYVVTAIGGDGNDESVQSSPASCSNNLFAADAYNTVSWTAVPGATRYNVYKVDNGLYGFIGQTTLLTFVDDNITPDLSQTPPLTTNPFVGAGNYPGAVSYFEQRRSFAGTLLQPQNMWLTKSGTESNLSYSIPGRDDDSIAFRIAAREANTIRHLVPLNNLILLTSSAEWRVTSVNSDALTPSSVSVRPQSYVGASNVTPLIVNNNLLYAAARGGHIRELAYSNDANGYLTGDVSLRAPHLFDGYQVVDMAFAKSPQPIVWLVSTSGKLLGFTYVPDQQVGAWHQHDTDGAFESCCTVAEGDEDVLYVVVQRTIGGVAKRYIERLPSRVFATAADAFFVDCGLAYSGAAISTLAGLDHLEGETVSILGDGGVFPQQVVTGGQVELSQACSKIAVGLPITADLMTLPMAFETAGLGQGRQKNVNRIWLRVYRSGGILAGPAFDNLSEFKSRTSEPFGSPPELKTEEVEIRPGPSWGDNGQVCVRQSDPLPLTLVALSMETSIGG